MSDPHSTPRFGPHLLDHWLLDRSLSFLNHGSFGATPLAVLEVQSALRAELEHNPVRFLYGEHPHRLRAAIERLAPFLGARPEDLAFVENATTGVNAVVRSIDLAAGDEIVALNHGYPAVNNALRYVASRAGAHLVLAEVPFPLRNGDEVVEALERAMSRRTRLVVLDWITSATGLVLPVRRLVAACQSRGVPVMVDAAHAPGQVGMDLEELGADWVTGNCHKWLFAPKGTAFLWARGDRQHIHPTVISHGYGQGFTEEFDFTGTKDITGWLSVPAALDFLESLDPRAVRRYNHGLVNDAADAISAAWGTERPAPRSMTASMVTLTLPEGVCDGSFEACVALHDRLYEAHRIEVPVFPFGGRAWLRISAQVYNGPSDYHGLVELFR